MRNNLISSKRNRREITDKIAGKFMLIPAILISILLFAIFALLLLHSEQILFLYPLTDLIFSSSWKPLAGDFGFYPFIMGTIWVTSLAMIFSIPISIFTVVYF